MRGKKSLGRVGISRESRVHDLPMFERDVARARRHLSRERWQAIALGLDMELIGQVDQPA